MGRRQHLHHAIAAAIIATVTTVATDKSSADGVFPSPPATHESAARSRDCSRMQRPWMLCSRRRDGCTAQRYSAKR